MDLNFYMPTKVIMGRGCITKQAALLKEYGTRALIVTGMNSAKTNGSLQDVTEALQGQGIAYDLFDRVMANPTVACVYEGAAYAREKQSDFIIGIGGGSPMDAAKAIALLAVQDIPEEEVFLGKFAQQALPLVLVPTTAGTGSEVTPYAILTNTAGQTKTSIASPAAFPKLALLDAQYMKALSMEVTINTAIDALSHAIEGMLSVRATRISDSIARQSIQAIVPSLVTLSPDYNKPASEIPAQVREMLLYGSMLAGVVISHTGTTAVHSMGYSLTYFKNIDHGRANGLLLPSFLRFVMKKEAAVVNQILSAMSFSSLDDLEALFLRLLGERERITVQDVEKYAGIAIKAKNIMNSKVVPEREDLIRMYERSLNIV
ncbi:MAG TPA: iron-containing alcohol dehydrogenase [Clostridiales bacterium]|nr:iron-containing alcohol dehydrogenase [Clostridiales bacterium]